MQKCRPNDGKPEVKVEVGIVPIFIQVIPQSTVDKNERKKIDSEE